MSPTKTSFLHTLQVTLSFPSSVIDNRYLKTGLTSLLPLPPSSSICELVLAMVHKLSETEAVESGMGIAGSEAEWDELQSSSDKSAGTTESEIACVESQPWSNKPENAPVEMMTAGEKSGTSLRGSEVTCAESQKSCDVIIGNWHKPFLR